MTVTNEEINNFAQFMQDFLPFVSGSETFLSTLLTEKTISQLLDAVKAAENAIVSDPKLTANLYALGEQNALLNKAEVLGVASDLLKSSVVVAPIISAVYTDLKTGNNDAGQKAIASLGIGAMVGSVLLGTSANPKAITIIEAVVAGVLDMYWDDTKENTGGFLDNIQFSWNTQNSTWELNFEKTMSNMTTRFENDIETGHYFILDFAKNKDLYESFGNELINNWKTAA